MRRLIFLLIFPSLHAWVARAYTFISFDVRGAYATQARSINAAGWVCGTYTTSPGGPFHAFLRHPNGHITTIDIPGAAITVATSINDLGQIAGFWSPDPNASVEHGFVRDAAGTVTSFDAPGFTYTAVYGIDNRGELALGVLNEPGPEAPALRTATGDYVQVNLSSAATITALNDAGQIVGRSSVSYEAYAAFIATVTSAPVQFTYPGSTSTIANGINDRGVIAGSWNSGQGYDQVTHGYVRDPSGAFENLEFPGAVATGALGISNAGDIAGSYTTGNHRVHGFIAFASNGPRMETIDVPGAAATSVNGINAAGEICGNYELTRLGASHAFVRDQSGTITTFDVPGAAMTTAHAINDLGQVVGNWTPDLTGNVSHLFIRDPSGAITTFDPPNTSINSASAINDNGVIAIEALNEPGPAQPLLRTPDGTYVTLPFPGDQMVNLTGLNNAGDTSGCVYLNGGNEQGFLLMAGGASVTFAVPDATTATCATAVNDSGVVVGYYDTGYRGGERAHTFIRFPNGAFQTRDVNGSLATLAFAVNDAGWIAGYYDDMQGGQHGYVMRPGREPVVPPSRDRRPAPAALNSTPFPH